MNPLNLRDEQGEVDAKLHEMAGVIAATVADELSRRMRNGELSLPATYLSPAQVSALTGVSQKTLETLRSTRRGAKYFKVGRKVRYRVKDVHDWMESDPVD